MNQKIDEKKKPVWLFAVVMLIICAAIPFLHDPMALPSFIRKNSLLFGLVVAAFAGLVAFIAERLWKLRKRPPHE